MKLSNFSAELIIIAFLAAIVWSFASDQACLGIALLLTLSGLNIKIRVK